MFFASLVIVLGHLLHCEALCEWQFSENLRHFPPCLIFTPFHHPSYGWSRSCDFWCQALLLLSSQRWQAGSGLGMTLPSLHILYVACMNIHSIYHFGGIQEWHSPWTKMGWCKSLYTLISPPSHQFYFWLLFIIPLLSVQQLEMVVTNNWCTFAMLVLFLDPPPPLQGKSTLRAWWRSSSEFWHVNQKQSMWLYHLVLQ